MPAATAIRSAAFDIKSTVWTLTALRLQQSDPAALRQALDQRFADTPGLFEQEPVVIDLSPLCDADPALDWPVLLGHLRDHGMAPVGVQGGSAAQMASARASGLAEVPLVVRQAAAVTPTAPVAPQPSSDGETPTVAAGAGADPRAPTASRTRAHDQSDADAGAQASDVAETATAAGVQADPLAEAKAPSEPAAGRPALIVDKPLRSGQRVYARGCDLVILSVVSVGAEAIADGSIHVYAPLRGRAIAGARGDTTARIYSTCLEPQLVSIAGIYRTTESPLPADVAGRPAQVRLDGEKIIVEPLAS